MDFGGGWIRFWMGNEFYIEFCWVCWVFFLN